jgi:hypothetical protein
MIRKRKDGHEHKSSGIELVLIHNVLCIMYIDVLRVKSQSHNLPWDYRRSVRRRDAQE